MSCRGYSIIYPTRCERMLARRCRQQLIKSDLVGMRALSISFGLLERGGDSRATDCIGRKSPVAGWSRAKPCHRVLPCYRGRTKTESEIRPPLGRRAAANGSRAGGGGKVGRVSVRERERASGTYGQLSNKQTSPPLESKLAGAVPTFVISRDILRLPHVYADIQCTRIYISGRRKLAWECKNSPDLPTLFKNEFKLTPRSTTLSYRRVRRSLA